MNAPTAQTLFEQGVQAIEAGEQARAEACFRRATELEPAFAQALTNLAFVLDARGDTTAAEAMYRRALAAGGNTLQLHLNLGVLLAQQKRLVEAEQAYACALQCDPTSSALWSNLGALYLALQQEEDAQTCLDKALELEPANARARFNLAYLCLRQGRYEEGWNHLESRNWYAPLAKHFDFARWAGQPLLGHSMLVTYEAGHGDVIQFARYIPRLKALGASRISLLCHPALRRLMQTLAGIAEVIGLDEDLPRSGWDYWTPLMSLPYHLKTRADSIPADIPYLWPRQDWVFAWEAFLPVAGVRIGLVWKGNPKFENDGDRSLSRVRLLEPLWKVSNAQFVSLQKGAGEDELPDFCAQFPMIELGTRMGDFADLAAVVSQLDLVISVDTAVAHLAGALGIPCWVLLPHYMTDWRWGSEGAGTGWYPQHMRLVRQGRGEAWSEVIARIALDLEAFVQDVGRLPRTSVPRLSM